MIRSELAKVIFKILNSSETSLGVKDILHQIQHQFRANRPAGQVTSGRIASILQGELSKGGQVEAVSSSRWTSAHRPKTIAARLDSPQPTTVSRLHSLESIPAPVLAEQGETRENGFRAASSTPADPGPAQPILSPEDLASITAATCEEIAAVGDSPRKASLDIDGITLLPGASGNFVYRLILSSPIHVGADQTVTFTTRNPKDDPIPAVIVLSDDEGLVIECQKPLPPDAKLRHISFDPSFILRALEKFVLDMAPMGGRIARQFTQGIIPQLASVSDRDHGNLNKEQSRAVEEMAAMPLHLLWGPPGTGKTKTLGMAAVRWMRQKKRVLIVSTSNAAVDVAMKAVLNNVPRSEERRLILRLGTSLDPDVRQVTVAGKLAGQNSELAASMSNAHDELQKIKELLQPRGQAHDRLQALHAKAQRHTDQISQFNKQAMEAAPRLTAGVLVTGCTLAKMILDPDLRTQSFDIVIVDEASMVSLLYALAASFLATAHLVYAGDPKQLPPIVQAKGCNAARWFGQNVYNWFGVKMGDETKADRQMGDKPKADRQMGDKPKAGQLSMLQKQYRMTDQIGEVVSRLSYSGLLQHERKASGPKVEFINIDGEWQTTYCALGIKEDMKVSYYHLAAVPVVHALVKTGLDEVLLLTPFRPQCSLLSALAFDLREQKSSRRISASTIHRAQGSQKKVVIVDLTTHDPKNLVNFFKDRDCEQLFNVAISRAEDHLLILGSRAMLSELVAKGIQYWSRMLSEFDEGVDLLTVEEVVDDLQQMDTLAAIACNGAADLPALYCHHRSLGSPDAGITHLRRVKASRKLLVLPEERAPPAGADIIVRGSPDCPPVFVCGGLVCVPYRKKWLVVRSPSVSRVVWRIGFSHLADCAVEPAQLRRFFCPKCGDGCLVLKQQDTGWFLVCTNNQSHTCPHRERLSLKDAKLIAQTSGKTCDKGHPLTVRVDRKGKMFLGCENFPACKYSESLSKLSGM
jgi:AAA domain/Topoisomerase DNA binding C4 zinc finger